MGVKTQTNNPITVTMPDADLTLKACFKAKTRPVLLLKAATRFISDNPAVATVTAKGVITGVAEGTATIYIQDIGGLWCKTTVTVKAR